MRNPIRLKNFKLRFLPLHAVGIAILLFLPPGRSGLVWAAPLLALGLALRSWGAGHLVKNDVLTVTGPYAHLRHPLYAGTLLVATGFAVWLGGVISLILLAAVWPWFALHYFPRKERVESARLEVLYGPQYRAYHDGVPALWPRWSAWRPTTADGTHASSARTWSLERYSDNNELGTVIAVLGAALVFWIRAGWSAS